MTAFSVIVPAYNAQRTLEGTLTTLDRQLERDFEVVIVDDGSTDATGAIADRLVAERDGWQVIHQANKGLPGARNVGIAAATGRWIALLDADDLLLPGHLARLRSLLEARRDTGLAFTDAWVYDETRRRFERGSANGRDRPRPLPADTWAFFRALMWGNFVFGLAAFPRDLANAVGGYTEDLRGGEDWEFWLRIVASGAPVAGVDDRTAIYRVSAGQMSGDKAFMHNSAFRVWESTLERADLPPDVAADLRRRSDAHRDAAVGASAPRGAVRDLLGRSTRWAMPVRDYRLTRPRAVAPVADLLDP